MIWYYIPAIIGKMLFFMILVTMILQTLIVLKTGELLHDKSAVLYIRALYGIQAALSAAIVFKGITAMASIEGGIFLYISASMRCIALLSPLLFLLYLKHPIRRPLKLDISKVSIFAPLAYLPVFEKAPMPLPVFLFAFAASWMMIDAIHMLWSLRSHARSEITLDTMPHVLRSIDQGICVASRKGRILETNPAFNTLCEKLGIGEHESLQEFDRALKGLSETGKMQISDLDGGKTVHTTDAVYFLENSSFSSGIKSFIQISLSDITEIACTAQKLRQDNEELARENDELRAVISEIELEERMNARQRLSRAAHDDWSQRLTVAGLSMDILLKSDKQHSSKAVPEEISKLLVLSGDEMGEQGLCDLEASLEEFITMYRRLGIKIELYGQAVFTKKEQTALRAILREALANAARHAYAQVIEISFYEDGDYAEVLIKNRCTGLGAPPIEGQGLSDIRVRTQGAGGKMEYKKSDFFVLRVSFPRTTAPERRVQEQCESY